MRIYALYGRSRWIVVVFLALGGMAIGIGCWGAFSVPPAMAIEIPLQYIGCNSTMEQTQANRFALAWSGELAFDALVFFLILYKSFVLRRSGNKPLMSMILRDGSLYFAAMTASNLANILVILTAPPLAKGAGTFFTNVISATMMSRLMLNLRDPRVIEAHSRSGRTTERAAETALPVLTSVFTDDDERERETNTPIPDDIEMTPRNRGS
ncbi:hypothetical protein FIBSPDRAFT_293447 [Athelia psychrophila]|uniref:Uncharacterized protein n=1 Tax=Athelia psychrophila TaxID=1759441 RepID=A0A166R2A3_9AGAM|nr:hypothetical protein FIBSPDRAFT_459499 [Fibularhizoctonia sp. CBS 109695]KZP27819.1 hypothetical protein FIBSPDRAFT_293447 [Fibularhizoctonia sp. CBS 109695]